MCGMQRALSPILVGREHELGVLEDTLLAASRGDARVALITGEAGMGKTRLAEEIINRARKIGFEVLTGACSEAELALPYLPFVEAIGNYLGRSDLEALRERLGPSATELGRLFPRLAGSQTQSAAEDPAYARLRLCEALTEVLNIPAERRGLLLVLEDLHWADASTREVLDFLVRRLRTGRVMILGTYRSDEMHRKHPLLPTVQGWKRAGLVEVVELDPLNPDGVSAMVRAIFDTEKVTDEFRDFLHSRCEGNPFVLEEMLKLAMDRGDLYRTEKGWERKPLNDLRLPRTVKDTILLRVERLDKEQAQLLGAASVLGQSFEISLLAATSGYAAEAIEEALHAAEQQQILEEAGRRYRFRHALTREVIYEDLPAPKRERLHLRAAEVLRGRPGHATVEVAWHLMAAHAFDEAVPLCIEAARESYRQAAYGEAIELFRRALPHVVDSPTKASVLCELGTAYSRAGHGANAVDYLEQGVELFESLGDRSKAAGYRIELGRANSTAGDSGRAREAYERAARELELDGPSEALALSYMRIAAEYCFDFRYQEALAMAERALAVAETAGADSIRIWTYNFVGLALIGSGRTREGYDSLRRSYREAMEHDLRWIAGNAMHNTNALKIFSGEPRAIEVLESLGTMRDLNAGVWSSMHPLLIESQATYFTGEFERGTSAALKVIELASATGNQWMVRFAEIGLSHLFIEQGRMEEARPLLGITHEEGQRDQAEASAIIHFHLTEGDVSECRDAARLLLQGVTSAFVMDLAVQAFVADGAAEDARSVVTMFDAIRPWLAQTPFVLRAHARLELAEGNREIAIQHAKAALDSFQHAGYRPDAARTLLVLAEARSPTNAEQARIDVRAAADIASAIGSVAIRRQAEKLMERLGGELEPATVRVVEPPEDAAPGERLVTVLFADVRGYTAIAGALAPAELSDRIAALQRWALVEIERHRGVVDKFAGDAMMATFNVAGASIDHCLHALQAALALRDKAAMLGLPIGVGIATGPAVVGRMARGANLSVLGEATNLASRLQAQAGAGEVLLSDESNRRVAAWLSERGMPGEPVRLALKGIEGETLVYRLGAPVEVASA
jgi:class 3 adenylate cyclase/tetratricopeptide (TPR) repeat protein